jgi:hypothetical protein
MCRSSSPAAASLEAAHSSAPTAGVILRYPGVSVDGVEVRVVLQRPAGRSVTTPMPRAVSSSAGPTPERRRMAALP